MPAKQASLGKQVETATRGLLIHIVEYLLYRSRKRGFSSKDFLV
jgi:hypothetical protein